MSIVLAMGDPHCPGMRDDYVPFLESVSDYWQCDEFVCMGDLVDWNSISFHEKNPCLPNPEEEKERAYEQVQEIVASFPNVEWLIGNHDELTKRKAVAAGLPPSIIRDYHDQWDLPDTWNVHDRFSSIEIDGVLYQHGDKGGGGKYPHINQAMQNHQSTVIGHFHSVAGVEYSCSENHRIFGMCVGTGADTSLMQFDYGKRYPRKPINACGVVVDGEVAIVEPMLL